MDFLKNKINHLFLFLLFIFNSHNLFGNCISGNCDDGFGTWQSENYKYIGQFQNSLFNGQGTTMFDNGDSHVGTYKDDLFNGFGTYLYNNGDKYIGNFLDDQFHGEGIYTYSDGDIYEGEYKFDKKNGYGEYLFFDGDRYEGEWKDGKYHGLGKYTYANGEVYEGIFENDEFISENIGNSNNINTNFLEDFFKIELSQKTIKEFIENSNINYDVFEFIDDNSFSIKNVFYDDGISKFKIGEITVLELDYYAINKIKLNSELNINLFDKFIIKNYTLIEDNIDHKIEYFEVSNLNIKNSSLIYDFLNSSNSFNFDTFENFENIFYLLDTIGFDKIVFNGAKIKESDSYSEWEKFEFNKFENMKFDEILLTDFYFDDQEAEQKGELVKINELEFNRPQNMTVFDTNDPDFVLSILKSLNNFSAENFWYTDKQDNVTLNSQLYEISNFKTTEIDNLLFPISIDFSLKNTYFSNLNPEFNIYLNLLGYDNLYFDFDISSSINYTNDEFVLNFKTFFYDALQIESQLLFSNLSLNDLNLFDDNELISYFSNDFKFNSFDIKLTDYGLTENIFVFLNEIYGVSKDEIIDLLLQEINNDINLQNTIDKKYINKIVNFIDNPTNLKFSVNPLVPISYNDLLLYSMDPVGLIDILNLTLD